MSSLTRQFLSFFQSSNSLEPYRLYSNGDYQQLPVESIHSLSSKSIARHTGPDLGLVDIERTSEQWQNPNQQYAYGHSTSLYDRNPLTGVRNGDPIADCFAISTQENNAILIIADGVNWGVKAQLAARCAVYASMKSLQNELFQSKIKTTKNIFECLRSSIDAAQRLIVEREGTLTTLTISVVCSCRDRSIVCTAIVGDSNAYVYSPKQNSVFELTEGSRDSNNERDMRFPGGVLGTTMTEEADLCNLTYSIMNIDQGDFIFLTTDGISDNYDPYVNQIILSMSPPERHRQCLEHLHRSISGNRTAADLCHCLIDEVTELTNDQRRFIEEKLRQTKDMNQDEKRQIDCEISDELKTFRGKLDHASTVVYQIVLFEMKK